MKIVDTMSNQAKANHPKRRFYSEELKAEVVQQCTQGGASVARVALHHGINANIVHRWLKLTPFRGHLIVLKEGVRNAYYQVGPAKSRQPA